MEAAPDVPASMFGTASAQAARPAMARTMHTRRPSLVGVLVVRVRPPLGCATSGAPEASPLRLVVVVGVSNCRLQRWSRGAALSGVLTFLRAFMGLYLLVLRPMVRSAL